MSVEDQLAGVKEPLRSIALQIIAESGGRIGITGMGGFRTRDMQAKLYDQYRSGNGPLAARPGHSEHERGMAIDFSGDKELLAQLAAKHGLVASVPGEDWHYTLGEGARFADDDSTEFPYDLSADANPQDVLANRMTSVLRILGGASPVGTRPQAGFDEELASLSFPNADTDPVQQIGRVGAQAATSGAKAALQAYAKSKLAAYGWTSAEMNALIELWTRESGWNPAADNPTSTAQGIAQKMQSVHGPVESTGEAQIDWGLNYIKERYGSPSKALSHHDRNNWY